MNKGVIYKIKIEESGNIKYCIRLDRNVKIEDKEYNIYVDKNKKDNNYANAATLFSVDREFDPKIPLPVCTGKKYNFELDEKCARIISIEETAISND